MVLSEKQKKEFFRIRRDQGRDAAQQYRAGILGTVAPQAQRPQAGYDTTQQIVQAQQEENRRAQQAATPNVNTAEGSRQVVTDPVTGQTTINEMLSPEQRRIRDDAFLAQVNQGNAWNQLIAQGLQQGQFQGPSMSDLPTFDTQQQEMFKKSMESFDAQNNEYFSRATQQLDQQLMNEGLQPGTPQYSQRMSDLMKVQAQQRGQASRDAFADSFNMAQSAQGQALQRQQQQYTQALGNYSLPFQLAQQFSGATQYQRPDFGPVASMPYSPVNVGNIGLGFNQQRLDDRRFRQDMRFQRDRMRQERELAEQELATRRQTAGAGSIGLGGQMALEAQRHQNDLDLLAAQQAQKAFEDSGL